MKNNRHLLLIMVMMVIMYTCPKLLELMVRNYGAEDTSKVTRCESDAQLGGFTVIFFAFCEDVIIEELHEPFEGHKLDNGVGNLSSPQGS